MAELGAGGDGHRGGDGAAQSETASDGCKVQDKKTASSRPSATVSGQNSSHSGNKPDPPPVLRVDDRQRLARERREERDKQLGTQALRPPALSDEPGTLLDMLPFPHLG